MEILLKNGINIQEINSSKFNLDGGSVYIKGAEKWEASIVEENDLKITVVGRDGSVKQLYIEDLVPNVAIGESIVAISTTDDGDDDLDKAILSTEDIPSIADELREKLEKEEDGILVDDFGSLTELLESSAAGLLLQDSSYTPPFAEPDLEVSADVARGARLELEDEIRQRTDGTSPNRERDGVTENGGILDFSRDTDGDPIIEDDEFSIIDDGSDNDDNGDDDVDYVVDDVPSDDDNDNDDSYNRPEIITERKTLELDEDTQEQFKLIINENDAENIDVIAVSNNGDVNIDDNTITFIPNENYNGDDTITITYTDGTNIYTETVQVIVNPVNDAPEIKEISNQTMVEDTQKIIELNVIDIDSDSLDTYVTVTSGNATIVDGNIVYVPEKDYNGTVDFTIHTSDGELTDTETFSIDIENDNTDMVIRVDEYTEYTTRTETVTRFENETRNIVDEDANAEAGYYEDGIGNWVKDVVVQETVINTVQETRTREVETKSEVETPTKTVTTTVTEYRTETQEYTVTRDVEETFMNTRTETQQEEVTVEHEREVVDTDAMESNGWTLEDGIWSKTETSTQTDDHGKGLLNKGAKGTFTIDTNGDVSVDVKHTGNSKGEAVVTHLDGSSSTHVLVNGTMSFDNVDYITFNHTGTPGKGSSAIHLNDITTTYTQSVNIVATSDDIIMKTETYTETEIRDVEVEVEFEDTRTVSKDFTETREITVPYDVEVDTTVTDFDKIEELGLIEEDGKYYSVTTHEEEYVVDVDVEETIDVVIQEQVEPFMKDEEFTIEFNDEVEYTDETTKYILSLTDSEDQLMYDDLSQLKDSSVNVKISGIDLDDNTLNDVNMEDLLISADSDQFIFKGDDGSTINFDEESKERMEKVGTEEKDGINYDVFNYSSYQNEQFTVLLDQDIDSDF